jgi:putative transposase
MKTQVRRAYKFRIYPTSVQEAELREWERQLRWLYNLAHEQRLMAFARPREERPRVDYFRQSREMTEIVRVDPQLGRVLCCARQEILRDLDKAWQRWRKKLGGRPHFKRRTDSVRFYLSTPKHWKADAGVLTLSGIAGAVGPIKLRQDRPWPGDAKFSSCHLVRDVDQWFAVFPLEYSVVADKPKGGAIGINRGAVHAVADSYGRVVDSPHHYTKALARIAHLSRELARKESGSRNRHKAAVNLAKAHRKIRRQREWFLHDQSAYYTKKYDLIGIEDWSTKAMTSSEPDPKIEAPKHLLNRKILDVGWYELARQIDYKAEATGARVVHVLPGPDDKDPAGISTMDSFSNQAMASAASGEAYADNGLLGDVNAARNVLLRALRAPKDPLNKKTPKASIKIKGRAVRPSATGKQPVEASGGDAPARAPVERGTLDREVGHPERTVEPQRTHPAGE